MKKSLGTLFFTVFLDMLGIGILIPIMPQLFANPNSPYYLLHSSSVTNGYLLLGLLTAIYPIAVFFAAPILGQLSDKYGRKPVLVVSLFGTSIGYVLFAVGIAIGSLPLLFISRLIDGITGGNISVAQAAIGDVSTKEDRAKNFGMIGAAFGLGFILGPFLGGKLADSTLVSWFTIQTPFYAAALFAFLNTLSILSFFKETHHERTIEKINFAESLKQISAAKRHSDVRTLFLTNFLMSAGFAFFTSFFNVFLTNKFGFTEGQIGNFFAYIGICVVITQAVITRAFAKRFKDTQILTYSYFATAFFLLCYLLPTKSSQFLFVTPLFAMANGLTQANTMALLSRRSDPRLQGEVLGINAGFMSLAQAIPPLIAGVIAAVFSPAVPIIIGAGMIGIAGVFFLHIKGQHTHKA